MQWRSSTLVIFVSFSHTYARWKARGNPVQFYFLSQIFGRSKKFFSKSNTKNCHLSNQFWSRNFVSKSNHLFAGAVSNQKISNETPCSFSTNALREYSFWKALWEFWWLDIFCCPNMFSLVRKWYWLNETLFILVRK